MSGGSPRFSVIVPAYDAEATIEETLLSVQAQTIADWEVCVADDGSTDGTLAIVERMAQRDRRITVSTAERGGTAVAENRAAEMARGHYLVILGADDLILPAYLESMGTFAARHPDAGILCCNGYWDIRVGGRTVRKRMARPGLRKDITLADMLMSNRILGLAVVEREVWSGSGGLRTDLLYAEDWEFWLRAMASGVTVAYNPEPLAVYRTGAVPNKSSRKTLVIESALSFLADLGARDDLPPDVRAVFPAALRRLRRRLEVARLEARMTAGDFAGARRTYLLNGSATPTRLRFVAGLAVMTASPRLYRRLFLPMT